MIVDVVKMHLRFLLTSKTETWDMNQAEQIRLGKKLKKDMLVVFMMGEWVSLEVN